LIAERLATRKDHFRPASLRDGQFATREPSATDEIPITVRRSAGGRIVDHAHGILCSPARSRQYVG
jgi:gluconate kinase